jgi:transposase-like protein
MKRGYQKKDGSPGKKEQPEVVQLALNREQLLSEIRRSLDSWSMRLGGVVARELLLDEVEQLCGERHERMANRTMSRHGQQGGVITVGGQRMGIVRPRVRSREGREVELKTYRMLQRPEAMPPAVLRRMVRGVSCRDYRGVVEMAREGFGVGRSSVSRAFVEATSKQLQELAERRFDQQRFAAILIDGVEYVGSRMIVALGISTDGQKRVLGLREGATENAAVVIGLLEELCERGLSSEIATLFVIDGSKALRAAIQRLWGANARIQRCQFHKKQNVLAHVPDRHRAEVELRLNKAYGEVQYATALKSLKTTVRWLERISPDAARSLQEGMEETLTVTRLQLPSSLRAHLKTTNIIESALSVTRTITCRVKRWRDGHMRLRWCAAGLLEAEQRFRRIKGFVDLPKLISVLDASAGYSTMSQIA